MHIDSLRNNMQGGKIMPRRSRRRDTPWSVLVFVLLLPVLIVQSAAGVDNKKRTGENVMEEKPLLFSAASGPYSPPPDVPDNAEPPPPSLPADFVIGEMLIKFKEHVTPDDPAISSLLEEYDGELTTTHKMINVHLYKLNTVKTKEETIEAIKKFSRHPLVEFAEPNGMVSANP